MGELPLNQVIHGDCVKVLKSFPDDCIDLVVTDPPYGLSFMGKDWDKSLPPRAAFEEIHRVLKPGALCFVMSSPRQDLMWRMMKLLEDSGFDLGQSFISWVYKTGFPKAYDVSKGIDTKKGLKGEVIGFKKLNPRDKKPYPQNAEMGYHGGNEGGLGKEIAPVSDEAKRWSGWKSITGLKPALEPILMVNKPLSEKTIVDNVLRWGTGAINIDACRIPFKNESAEEFSKNFDDSKRTAPKFSGKYNQGKRGEYREREPQLFEGRFPANILVSDGALDKGEITKSSGGANEGKLGVRVYGKFRSKLTVDTAGGLGDVGDQSRYFDLDRWAEHHGILDVPKPDAAERDYGLTKLPINLGGSLSGSSDGSLNKRTNFKPPKIRNIHPTVKPIKLMAFLIELGCPKDGVVLDPFVGSGTTCIAAKQLGRRYIGIEISEEYHRLAEARVSAYPQPLEWFTEVMEQ